MTVLALDLDGVVITGHRAGGGRWAKHLEADLGISPDHLRQLFFKPHFGEIICGRADLFEVLGDVWPALGPRCTVREFVDYWFAADSRRDEALLAAVAAWRTASDRRCVLATNQEHHRATYVWDRLHLSAYFDEIIYSAAVGAKKPDPSYFDSAAAKLGVAPSAIIFFDDSQSNVDTAAAVGWRAHLYRDVAAFRDCLGDVG